MANEVVSEVILGLDWLVTSKVNVDMAEMVLHSHCVYLIQP